MEESKRQKQVARLVHDEMNEIFQKEGLTMFEGGMVSIAKVIVTPDLLEARFFLNGRRNNHSPINARVMIINRIEVAM